MDYKNIDTDSVTLNKGTIDINSTKINDKKINFKTSLHGTAVEGTKDYEKLVNQPKINSIILIGDKTSNELKLQDKMSEVTLQEIDEIIYGGN